MATILKMAVVVAALLAKAPTTVLIMIVRLASTPTVAVIFVSLLV